MKRKLRFLAGACLFTATALLDRKSVGVGKECRL